MTVIRVVHQENIVPIDRNILWDKNLSLKAIGLLARLISRPDDWHLYIHNLCPEDFEIIESILVELILNSYLDDEGEKEILNAINANYQGGK